MPPKKKVSRRKKVQPGSAGLSPKEILATLREESQDAAGGVQANGGSVLGSYRDPYGGHDLIIAEGPAGTGKTYTSIALAVRALKEREVKKIILTRPAVEAGERLGFLPGDMKEKLDPYLQPLYDALHDMLPFKKLETWLEDGTIQIAPLAYMRGRTLESAFVILDEAQNATISQLKMFLTRMGVSSKFIITGDSTQIDLPKKSDSGLNQVIRILGGIEGVSVIKFDERDIVRHKLVRMIVKAYEKEENGVYPPHSLKGG